MTGEAGVYIFGLDLNGNVIQNLQDPNGEVYPNTTSALEHDGMLNIAGYADGLGCIPYLVYSGLLVG